MPSSNIVHLILLDKSIIFTALEFNKNWDEANSPENSLTFYLFHIFFLLPNLLLYNIKMFKIQVINYVDIYYLLC